MPETSSMDSTALDFCLNLNRVTASLLRKMDNRLSALHGLSFNDFTILHTADQAPQGKIRRSDLAAHLGLTASAVTRMLIPLEKIGLVSRLPDPRDARVSYVVVTPTGQDLLRNARQSARENSQELVGQVPPAELEALSALLDTLA